MRLARYAWNMSGQMLHAKVTEEGTAVIPPDEVASLGAHPGDRLHLRLVGEGRESPSSVRRESLYGALQLAQPVPYEAFEKASREAAADAEPTAWPS